MSGMERNLMKLGGLPPRPNVGPGAVAVPGAATTGARPKRTFGHKKDYTPVPWGLYFDAKEEVVVDNKNTFRVYMSGIDGPVCFFLHGGGFSALSWACLSKILTGFVTCRCVAMDFRGHGNSKNNDETDMSADTLAQDVGNVIQKLYGDDPPQIILVGHSMGGAIAVHTASRQLIPSLIGLAVIDVVEGTAMEALNSMQSFLRGRPQSFKSLEKAIEWCVRTGQIRNLESAKVSMVGQLKKKGTREAENISSEPAVAVPSYSNVIREEEEGEEEEGGQAVDVTSRGTQAPKVFAQPAIPGEEYTWRIDLASTEKFWRGWFEGLSTTFLELSVPKILILAGIDRLDKDLIVGQMQGKFQMQVLPQCGHAVHEDVPERVAEVLATFMVRHKVVTAKESFEMSFPGC